MSPPLPSPPHAPPDPPGYMPFPLCFKPLPVYSKAQNKPGVYIYRPTWYTKMCANKIR